jgi:hypothetical protein
LRWIGSLLVSELARADVRDFMDDLLDDGISRAGYRRPVA